MLTDDDLRGWLSALGGDRDARFPYAEIANRVEPEAIHQRLGCEGAHDFQLWLSVELLHRQESHCWWCALPVDREACWALAVPLGPFILAHPGTCVRRLRRFLGRG